MDGRGHSFLSLNEELLQRYAACNAGQEIVSVQMDFLERLRQEPAPKVESGEIMGTCAMHFICFEWSSLTVSFVVPDFVG